MTDSPGTEKKLPFIYLALPVMDEPDFLPQTLQCISNQTYRRFRLVVCVNQPESWWNDPLKIAACHNNQQIINRLERWDGCDLMMIDRSSKGRGWVGKRHGVGHARKVIMDFISDVANQRDLIVSLDADTTFPENYLETIALNFARQEKIVATAVPYYHKLTGDEKVDRAMLRYEIYMRHYFLSMAIIGSPYVFTALGSAMAVPVWAYRAIGGMTPKMSGEDFYFLQKLRKFGYVGLWNDACVFPAARFSDRVYFGTGPAMIRGAGGDWSSYPIYPSGLFDQVKQTYNCLPALFSQTLKTAVVEFLSDIFREDDPLQPLRKNHREMNGFIRAFHEKFDGLRVLQYLKTNHDPAKSADEANLFEFLSQFYPEKMVNLSKTDFSLLSFEKSPVSVLTTIREFLFEREMEVRFSLKPG